jgi:hypothetical protein
MKYTTQKNVIKEHSMKRFARSALKLLRHEMHSCMDKFASIEVQKIITDIFIYRREHIAFSVRNNIYHQIKEQQKLEYKKMMRIKRRIQIWTR